MLEAIRAEAAAHPDSEALRAGLRTLAYELTLAEARERERIARGLHDEIGQLLAVAHFRVGLLRSEQAMPAERQAEALRELSDLLLQATRATRSATFELGSPTLRLGFEEALVELIDRLRRTGGPPFRLDGHLPPGPLPEPVLCVLYRVVRELALNVQRHARARQAWIELGGDTTRLTIRVVDDGIGLRPDWADRGLSPDGGFGLVSACAQMQALGGTLRLESGLGAGTHATLSVPLEAAGDTGPAVRGGAAIETRQAAAPAVGRR